MAGDELTPKAKSENVQVVIRCRPLSKTEVGNSNKVIVDMNLKTGNILVKNPSGGDEPPKSFTFDQVYDMTTKQVNMYTGTASGLVDSVMEGFNGTIFAYGQTGTGKTFSMEGEPTPDMKGVIPRAFDQVFEQIEASEGVEYLVRASFLELYNEDVFDLLATNREKLTLHEDPERGVYVKNLQSFVMKGVKETNELLQEGKKSRQVGATKMNAGSSRSHCIFTMTVESSQVREGSDESHICVGKLNMVDLAGSERQVKTGATGMRLKEATKINLSLSALGNVISALTSKKKGGHIPYRDSKLTRLLQDSLGGNSKTVMIAAIGPADYNYDETVSTLRFANRAKSIKNKPKINEDPKDAMLREYQDEITKLKAMLAAEGLSIDPNDPEAMAAFMAGGLGKKLPPKKVVIEKIVKKVVHKGVTKDKLQDLETAAAAARAAMEEKRLKEREDMEAFKKQMEGASAQTTEEIKTTAELLEQKKKARLEMEAKLKDMQEKLLVGDKIIDDAKKQKIQITRKQAEMQRQRLEAERLQRELQEKEEAHLELADQYESQDKEVAAKTKKLDKLRTKYTEINQELADLQSDNQKEREELLEMIREFTRHIQLKDMIAQHFIPDAVAGKMEGRAVWDEASEEWAIKKVDFAKSDLYTSVERPPSAKPNEPRPITEHARIKIAVGDANPRWRHHDVVQLELDMPERTTQDYNDLQNELNQQAYGGGGDPRGRGGGGVGYDDRQQGGYDPYSQQQQQRGGRY